MSTPITLTGAYTCTHHNDQQRTDCPVCLVAALTAERDQLRVEVERLETNYADYAFWKDAAKTRANHLESASQQMLAHEDTILQLRVEVERLERRCDALIDSVYLSDTAFLEQKARAERAEAELAIERARLDFLSKRDGAFDHIRWGDYHHYWGKGFTSLRETIDAAMKEVAK